MRTFNGKLLTKLCAFLRYYTKERKGTSYEVGTTEKVSWGVQTKRKYPNPLQMKTAFQPIKI